MDPKKQGLIAERFKTTLALFELAEAMLRQKLRRKYPLASEVEIQAHVQSGSSIGREPSTETELAARSRGLAGRESSGRRSPPTHSEGVSKPWERRRPRRPFLCGPGSKVEDPAHCRDRRAFPQEIPRSGKPVHHSRVQEGLTASQADVSLNGYQRHVVAFSDAALDVAATVKFAGASRTDSRALCGHRFTRLLRSDVHRAGSGL